MSLLDTILARRAAPAVKATAPRPVWLRASEASERYAIPDVATVERQATVYDRLSWIKIAIEIVSQSAASVPFQVLHVRGEDTRAIANHPFEILLKQPNPEESRYEFFEATFAWYKIAGTAYWWLNRPSDTVPPSELFVIPTRQIVPVPDGRMGISHYDYDPGSGQKIRLEAWEVCQFKSFNPFSRYVGRSAMESLRYAALGDLAAQEWKVNFFGKDNAKPGGILAFADPLPPDIWAAMKSDVQAQSGGTKNKRMLMLQNVGKGGVEFVQTAVNQTDMQFLEDRQFTKEEIWGALAPGLANMLDTNATEANAKTGEATLNARAVWPMLSAVAEKIALSILPSYGDGLTCAFDDVRHKDVAMLESQQTSRAARWTINELRAEDGKDPLKGELWENVPAQAALRVFDPTGEAIYTGLTKVEQPPPPPQIVTRPPPQLTGPVDQAEEAQVAPMDMAAMGKAEDLRKWERKALNRLRDGRRAACTFDSDHLTAEDVAPIHAALEAARTEDAVKAAFEREVMT